jgi:hypothetical protein
LNFNILLTGFSEEDEDDDGSEEEEISLVFDPKETD